MRKAYQDARERAVSIDRSTRGRIVVSGADRASYLHALLTNDINALKPGRGCYAAYLTPQGRMISDLYVYELGGEILVVVPRHVKDIVLGKLDRFIFTEDVTVGDATGSFADVAIVGPAANHTVSGLFENASIDRIGALPVHGNLVVNFAGTRAIITRVADT